MNNTNLILTTIDSMTMYSPQGELLFVLDDLQNISIQNDEESTEITGKGGRKLSTLKQNKAVTITGANGIISSGLLSVQTGGAYEESESYPVSWQESIRIEDPKTAYTTHKAVGFAGAEIKTIVRESFGGSLDTINQLKQGTAPATGVFTYDPDSKKLEFADDEFETGDLIRVFYTRNVPATHISNPADEFSKMGMAIFDCTARDLCENYYRSQIIVPRADFKGTFTMDIGTEQAVHNFELEALASVSQCDRNTTNQESIYWSFVTFGRDVLDAE